MWGSNADICTQENAMNNSFFWYMRESNVDICKQENEVFNSFFYHNFDFKVQDTTLDIKSN